MLSLGLVLVDLVCVLTCNVGTDELLRHGVVTELRLCGAGAVVMCALRRGVGPE